MKIWNVEHFYSPIKPGKIKIAVFCFFILLTIICIKTCKTSCGSEFDAKQTEFCFIAEADHRVELMSIIFHLAGNREYNAGRIPSYTKDVDEYFEAFREHKAIKLARILRYEKGTGYDAPMALAVNMDENYYLLDSASGQNSVTLGLKWKVNDAEEFLMEVRSFAEETRFSSFFKRHESSYRQAREAMESILDKKAISSWLNRFFSVQAGTGYVIIPALLNGGACYGASARNSEGTVTHYAIIGVKMIDNNTKPGFDKSVIPVIIHEFCHSFVNPVINENRLAMKEAGTKMFPLIKDKMKALSYGTWGSVLCESVVRACVIRYMLSEYGSDAAGKETEKNGDLGFIWSRELSELLGEFESNLNKYNTFALFFPSIVDFFNIYAGSINENQRVYDEKVKAYHDKLRLNAPVIVSSIPVIGSQDVDPSIRFIEITFNREMKRNIWAIIDGPYSPEITGEFTFNSTGTVFRMPVLLRPSLNYEFMLNFGSNMGFQDEMGNPLLPVRFYFKTGKK